MLLYILLATSTSLVQFIVGDTCDDKTHNTQKTKNTNQYHQQNQNPPTNNRQWQQHAITTPNPMITTFHCGQVSVLKRWAIVTMVMLPVCWLLLQRVWWRFAKFCHTRNSTIDFCSDHPTKHLSYFFLLSFLPMPWLPQGPQLTALKNT